MIPAALLALFALAVNYQHRAEIMEARPMCQPEWWLTFNCPAIKWGSPLIVLGKSLTLWSPVELPVRLVATLLLLVCAYWGACSPDADRRIVRALIVMTLLYLFIPWGVVDRVYYMRDRVLVVLQFAWVLAARPPTWLRSASRLGPPAFLLCLTLCVAEYREAARLSPVIDAIREVGQKLPRGASLSYLNLLPAGTNGDPLQFGWSFLTVDRDAVTAELFADGLSTEWGGVGFRPLTYTTRWPYPPFAVKPYSTLQQGLRLFDYLVVIQPDADLLPKLRADFEVVSQSGPVWLFRTSRPTEALPPV